MNYIIMANDHISAFTEHIEAEDHSHWALQLWICLNGKMNITVQDREIQCRGIVIDGGISHRFSACDQLHFTMLLEPTSSVAVYLKKNIIPENTGYFFLEDDLPDLFRDEYAELLSCGSEDRYRSFINTVYRFFHIDSEYKAVYDDRIIDLLRLLDQCDCSEHGLIHFAKKISLSASRLSHLFKQQTGIPLKGYLVLHKLEKAYTLLLNEKRPITEAAMLAGFDSPSHLAYTSKALTGMTLSGVMKDSVFLKVSALQRV